MVRLFDCCIFVYCEEGRRRGERRREPRRRGARVEGEEEGESCWQRLQLLQFRTIKVVVDVGFSK